MAFAFRVVKMARFGLVIIVGRIFAGFDVFDGIVETFGNLLKVFLIEENLVLLVEEAI